MTRHGEKTVAFAIIFDKLCFNIQYHLILRVSLAPLAGLELGTGVLLLSPESWDDPYALL